MRAPAPPGRLIDVGGFRLHLNCSGEGSPAVILDAALGGSSLSWALVQPEIAKLTRVCAYDRAGFGWSEAGPILIRMIRAVDGERVLIRGFGKLPSGGTAFMRTILLVDQEHAPGGELRSVAGGQRFCARRAFPRAERALELRGDRVGRDVARHHEHRVRW